MQLTGGRSTGQDEPEQSTKARVEVQPAGRTQGQTVDRAALATKLLAPVVPTITQMAVKHHFMRRRERLELDKAERRAEALRSVQSSRSAEPTQPAQDDDHAATRLDELIARETCGTCQMALEEMKDLEEPERSQAVRTYLEDYKPVRQAFEAGEASEEDLERATMRLLDVADL